MTNTHHIDITSELSISAKELKFTFTRSSGSGGQNVNKVNTKVTLWFDLDRSPSLSRKQKKTLHEVLGARINQQGILRITAGRQRRQVANRREAIARFTSLLQDALSRPTLRKKTTLPRRAYEKRLRTKKRRARLKRLRQRPINRE